MLNRKDTFIAVMPFLVSLVSESIPGVFLQMINIQNEDGAARNLL